MGLMAAVNPGSGCWGNVGTGGGGGGGCVVGGGAGGGDDGLGADGGVCGAGEGGVVVGPVEADPGSDEPALSGKVPVDDGMLGEGSALGDDVSRDDVARPEASVVVGPIEGEESAEEGPDDPPPHDAAVSATIARTASGETLSRAVQGIMMMVRCTIRPARLAGRTCRRTLRTLMPGAKPTTSRRKRPCRQPRTDPTERRGRDRRHR